MSEYTPDPWIYDDNEGFGPNNIWHGCSPSGHGITGKLVATIVGDDAESEANAYLIAEAPNLLKALESMIEKFEAEIHSEYGGTGQLNTRLAEVDFARQVVAHAKGGR